MANENTTRHSIFKIENGIFGVSAEVLETTGSHFEVVVRDMDAERIRAVKYVYTAKLAIELAQQLCI